MNKENVWLGDELDRKRQADELYRIFKSEYSAPINHEHNLIVNIDAPYGFGKTFFVSNWSNDLKQKGHISFVFDAWKNDYASEPLEPFLSEIISQITDQLAEKRRDDGCIQSLLAKMTSLAPKMIAASVPVAATAATMLLTGIPFTPTSGKNQFLDLLPKLAGNLASVAMQQHKEREKTISEFRELFTELFNTLKAKNHEEPVYIFIDELDRCKPTYAIELLERVKHIFDIYGLCFVFCTTTTQLCACIRSVYGNSFDAESYLRRFFSRQYSLSTPNYSLFSHYLFKKLGSISKINEKASFFIGKESTTKKETELADVFAFISESFGLSLRDQEQLYVHLKLFIISINLNVEFTIHLHWALFLLTLKLTNKPRFDSFMMSRTIRWTEEGQVSNQTAHQNWISLTGRPPLKVEIKHSDKPLFSGSPTTYSITILKIYEIYNDALNINTSKFDQEEFYDQEKSAPYKYNLLREIINEIPDNYSLSKDDKVKDIKCLINQYPHLINSLMTYDI